MSFVAKLKTAGKDHSIYLLKSKAADGRATWFYLKIPHGKKQAFLTEIGQDKDVALEVYGSVLESGYGERPPRHIKIKIESEA